MCRNITLVAAVNSLLQTGLCVCFGVVAMLMYDCKLTPTPIQTSDPNNPSPLVAFTNSFYLQYFHSRNNCIARNDEYWKNINDTQTGVVTKSNQVHGMFIGYIVENGLWFICSILLFFGGLLRTKWIYVTYASTQFTVILYDVILIVIFALDFKSYKEFQGNPNTPRITKETMLVNIIVMLLIVSRFVVFLIVNMTFACLVQGFINSLPSSKMKQVKSHNKRKNASPSHHRPPQLNDPHQPPYDPYQQERFQPQHLYPPGYKASRYPDVVSHPGKFDDSSDEIIVSPAMRRYGSPSRNLPAVTNYREPRNFDAGRQQAALPPVRMPSKSHESVQHPYSSNRNNRMSDRRPSPPRQRYPPERHPSPDSYRSSTSYEGPPANYFDDSARKTSFNAKPQYNEDRRRQPTASAGNLPPPNEGESSQNVRFAAPMRRESFDRFSSSSDQLKNQRPWSYISPEDLPSSPNKLNQFYSSRNAMNEKQTSHALPAVDEYEPDHQPSVKQQRKREYHKRHSVELRQPLLAREESPRHRPPPVHQLYENVEPSIKKNVRFSKRTQSLDYLEKTSAESPVVKRIKQHKSKSPNKIDEKKKRVTKEFSSSGEELCTDEFLLLNYNHSFKKSQQQNVVADASKRTVRYPNKILTDLKRSPSSASSPNLVFDPASNTARLVYGEQQQSNKSFKVLQSPQQRKVYLNETSI
ncbi:serine/arginine repetitive matrix protein 1 isoform X1 [Daphnia magna]|uniref:serine/arginine repetitive matrix protein 1 isoform X1 n=1 Tax=Daphnia magna TaxID=35525 RepID=UPI001E1BB1FA|nr:serine/arginine repetitive matrix protein 1 isoform X1 [Daphnia magna]